MTIQELGSLGELIGAIATIATLIYLAVQIRHNTKLSRVSSLQTTLDGGRDHTIQPVVTNPDVAKIFARGMTSFEELDSEEQVRFIWFCLEAVLQMQNVMQLHDHGILDEVEYEAWLAYTAAIIVTPGGSEAWPQASAVVSPVIRDVLNNYLATHPEQPSLLELMPVMDSSRWGDGGS